MEICPLKRKFQNSVGIFSFCPGEGFSICSSLSMRAKEGDDMNGEKSGTFICMLGENGKGEAGNEDSLVLFPLEVGIGEASRPSEGNGEWRGAAISSLDLVVGLRQGTPSTSFLPFGECGGCSGVFWN